MNAETFRRTMTPGVAWTVLIAIVALVSGCSSTKLSSYISPRLTGTIVDAQTGKPIKGAKIQRLLNTGGVTDPAQLKGAQLIEATPPVRSDELGRFVVDSARDLSPFDHSGWWSVTIRYMAEGYATAVNLYGVEQSTNSPSGEPQVNAGVVKLQPFKR